MSQGLGGEAPRAHTHTSHRQPARYLVVIDSGGFSVARLFLATREQVAEFDASTEETVQMILGLAPDKGADGPDWDQALRGHSRAERATADIYTLAI